MNISKTIKNCTIALAAFVSLPAYALDYVYTCDDLAAAYDNWYNAQAELQNFNGQEREIAAWQQNQSCYSTAGSVDAYMWCDMEYFMTMGQIQDDYNYLALAESAAFSQAQAMQNEINQQGTVCT